MQDWVCISGAGGNPTPLITSIPQGADAWLDVLPYEDLVFYLDVKEVTNTVTMNYETAPIPQESSFLPMVPPFALTPGLRVDPVLAAYAAIPRAQFVRWRLTNAGGSGSWDVTFRIWLAAYSLEGT